MLTHDDMIAILRKAAATGERRQREAEVAHRQTVLLSRPCALCGRPLLRHDDRLCPKAQHPHDEPPWTLPERPDRP